jgi:cell division protein FtsI/penicillin-binding protein 2
MIPLLLWIALAPRPQNVEIAEIDLRTGAVIQQGWRDPAPVGSLIKPFTAMAYAAGHDYKYPEFVCTPGVCWLPAGHGRVTIREAVAYSCNAYFAKLASELRADDLAVVLRRFGLDPLPSTAGPDAFIGMGDTWRVKPLDLLRAYGELASRAAEPGVAELLEGMALSARSGTGKSAGAIQANSASRVGAEGWLVKTGTAPCVHAHHAPGDGYALGMYPARHPQRAVLVRLHGGTGAEAAAFVSRGVRE